MLAPLDILWAFIGLILTVGGTFVEAAWVLGDRGLQSQPLGITFQVGAVLLVGCLAGRNAGALSQISYLILGLMWLPVFGQGGGLGYVWQPTFGYLLGFVPGAWLCGHMAFRSRPRLEHLALSGLSGLLTIHVFGLAYLAFLYFFVGIAPEPWAALWRNAYLYSLAPLGSQLVVVCAVAVASYFLRRLLFS